MKNKEEEIKVLIDHLIIIKFIINFRTQIIILLIPIV